MSSHLLIDRRLTGSEKRALEAPRALRRRVLIPLSVSPQSLLPYLFHEPS